jgi:GMP synthase-like glutamine amidotransferase
LGWVGPIQAKRWQDTEWKTEIIREPEVVLWQKEKVLAVQGHPEWDNTKDGIFAYTMEQIQKYFGV